MKNFKIVYEVSDIRVGENSKFIRIIKDEDGKTYRIKIMVNRSTPDDAECHYWNGKEWSYVCGRYDTNYQTISVHGSESYIQYEILKTYNEFIKVINCLEN